MKTVWSWRLVSVNDLFYNLIFYSSGWNWTSNVSLQQTKTRVFGTEIFKFLCTEFRCKTKDFFFFFCNGCIVSWVIPLILICLIARFSGMLPFPHVFEKEFTSFHTSSKLFLKVFFGLFTLFFTCNLPQFTILFSSILLYWAEFQLSEECLFASSNSHCCWGMPTFSSRMGSFWNPSVPRMQISNLFCMWPMFWRVVILISEVPELLFAFLFNEEAIVARLNDTWPTCSIHVFLTEGQWRLLFQTSPVVCFLLGLFHGQGEPTLPGFWLSLTGECQVPIQLLQWSSYLTDRQECS